MIDDEFKKQLASAALSGLIFAAVVSAGPIVKSALGITSASSRELASAHFDGFIKGYDLAKIDIIESGFSVEQHMRFWYPQNSATQVGSSLQKACARIK